MPWTKLYNTVFASVSCKHLTTLAVVMCKLFHGSLKASCHHRLMTMWDEHSNCRHHNSQVFRVDKVCATHVIASRNPNFAVDTKLGCCHVYDMAPNSYIGQTWGLGALGGRNSWKIQKNTKMSNFGSGKAKVQDFWHFWVWEPQNPEIGQYWQFDQFSGGGGGGVF
jgi:hypothetical protein